MAQIRRGMHVSKWIVLGAPRFSPYRLLDSAPWLLYFALTMVKTDGQLIDLDGAWPENPLQSGRSLDCRAWGPRLRYCAPSKVIQAFYEHIAQKLTPFTL